MREGKYHCSFVSEKKGLHSKSKFGLDRNKKVLEGALDELIFYSKKLFFCKVFFIEEVLSKETTS